LHYFRNTYCEDAEENKKKKTGRTNMLSDEAKEAAKSDLNQAFRKILNFIEPAAELGMSGMNYYEMIFY
jgi:hypothetical protein